MEKRLKRPGLGVGRAGNWSKKAVGHAITTLKNRSMTKVRSNRTFRYGSPTFSLINDRGRTRQRTGVAALRGFRQKYRGARGEARGKQKGPPASVGPFASRSTDSKVVRRTPGAYQQIWNRRDVARYSISCEGRGLRADGRCRPWVLCVPAGGVSQPCHRHVTGIMARDSNEPSSMILGGDTVAT